MAFARHAHQYVLVFLSAIAALAALGVPPVTLLALSVLAACAILAVPLRNSFRSTTRHPRA
ncbi:hypothetical protein [Nocardia pneumoniae]|uniref:hypothetical protein n=1 Tax=Nocardia pneumoniae TaxID=228601 RepID=UPI00031AD87B|nr:hypothetical protein [Nocardia pneumoniae]